MKICRKCKKKKEDIEFHKSHPTCCKVCIKKKNFEWTRENPEKNRLKAKMWWRKKFGSEEIKKLPLKP